MADELQFDPALAGIARNKNWNDSQTFVNIAAGYGRIRESCPDIADPIVEKTAALSEVCAYVADLMQQACLEFSDSAGVLGSGVQAAIVNYDQAEQDAVDNFEVGGEFDFMNS